MRKLYLVSILVLICLGFGCTTGVSSRHLENIVAGQNQILDKIKQLESNQTDGNDKLDGLTDAVEQSNFKLDKLVADKSTGEIGNIEGQIEVRVYIIADKWKVWRYCTNIKDAISFLEQYE